MEILCIVIISTFIHRKPALANIGTTYTWKTGSNLYIPGEVGATACQPLQYLLYQLTPIVPISWPKLKPVAVRRHYLPPRSVPGLLLWLIPAQGQSQSKARRVTKPPSRLTTKTTSFTLKNHLPMLILL